MANLCDIAYLGINCLLIADFSTGFISQDVATLLEVAQTALMGFVFFKWLRVFESMVIFIRLIEQTIFDMVPFFLLYSVVTIFFSQITLILKQARASFGESRESLYDDETTNIDFVSSLLSNYLVTLGEFSFDSYR